MEDGVVTVAFSIPESPPLDAKSLLSRNFFLFLFFFRTVLNRRKVEANLFSFSGQGLALARGGGEGTSSSYSNSSGSSRPLRLLSSFCLLPPAVLAAKVGNSGVETTSFSSASRSEKTEVGNEAGGDGESVMGVKPKGFPPMGGR